MENRNRNRSQQKNEVEIEVEVENRNRNRNRSRQKNEVEIEIEVESEVEVEKRSRSGKLISAKNALGQLSSKMTTFFCAKKYSGKKGTVLNLATRNDDFFCKVKNAIEKWKEKATIKIPHA